MCGQVAASPSSAPKVRVAAVAVAATPAAALQIQFLISFKEQEVGRSFVTQTWAGLLL